MDKLDNAIARATLPPPEWTAPAAEATRKRNSTAPPPAPQRRTGERAEEASLRARLSDAKRSGDRVSEAAAAVELARWLARRDRDLDEAAQLALRALRVAEDPELRRELASWLESLGEAGLAAAVLRAVIEDEDDEDEENEAGDEGDTALAGSPGATLDAEDRAAVLVRVGVLHARAGDPGGASEAFEDAARVDAKSALALELRGTLGSWAPEVVSLQAASQAYVDAATRRRAAGEDAMEDILRAFEADPANDAAAHALVEALIERGKVAASDEIWREHARALAITAPAKAKAIHARRRKEALANGDTTRALAAAFDEGLDAWHMQIGEPAADPPYEPTASSAQGDAEDPHARYAANESGAQDSQPDAEDPHAQGDANKSRAHSDVNESHAPDHPKAPTEQRTPKAPQAQGEYEGTAAAAFDELLLRTGLFEMLAVRVEARAQIEAPRRPQRGAQEYATLAHLAAGQLDDPERAAEAYAEVHVLDPASEEAREALRAHAVRFDLTEVIEALDLGDPERVRSELRKTMAESPRRTARLEWVKALSNRDPITAARALEQLATDAAPPIRGVLHAVASERLLMAARALSGSSAMRTPGGANFTNALSGANGPTAIREDAAATLNPAATEALAAARLLGEYACQADPTSPRVIGAMAEACIGGEDWTSASALERVIKVVCPRGRFCKALAEALEKLDEGGYAVAWTQQYVALRPGDRTATQWLIERVVRAQEAPRLGDALMWVLSQPQPAGPLADLVGQGIRELSQLDAARAVIVARRALDVFGPRKAQLRAALLDAAERAGDNDLAGAIIERWIASGATAEERRELFIALAQRRMATGDHDGEARAIVRALRLGAPASALAERILALTEAVLSEDGSLAWLEARALLAGEGEDPGAAASAFRELGAALWDLAGDRHGAVEAWLRAAKLAPYRGYFTLAVDISRFGDPRFAFECLSELMEQETDRTASGTIAAEAARAALLVGEPHCAFDLATVALERDPEHAEALEIAEESARKSDRLVDLSALYDAMGDRALGRFGRRAAHYRGARFFEQHGDAARALKHASDAFVAVPSEGAALVLLERVADRAGNRTFAVRTLEQVAELSPRPAVRAGWLLRAASLADGDDAGLRQRVDCLLRAALLVPDVGTLSLLADAARELLRILPQERGGLALSISTATQTLTEKLEGPEGARTALRLAQLIVRLFDDAEGAASALASAFDTNADIDEYAGLLEYAGALSRASRAGAFMERAVATLELPYAHVGAAALKLLAAMALHRGDEALGDRLTLQAAIRDPEDPELVRKADEAARRLGDTDLFARFDKSVPPGERAEVFRAYARDRAMSGEYDEAIDAMERARILFGPEERSGVEAEIRTLYGSAGRTSDLERRTLARAEDESFQPRERADRYTEVAQRCEERGELGSAASLLRKAAELDPAPLARWSALERAAELARRTDVRIMALREIEKRVDADARPAVLRRLARALEDAGQGDMAISALEEVLDAHPEDEVSDQTVEAMIVATGDYERLAEHLAGRIARLLPQTHRRDALRAVRLRRVAILEQRLGRVEEACGELEELLREWPENDGALRYLADLYERTGQTHRAAPLWKHLSALAQGAETQIELELRAITATRDAGDLRGALALVNQLLEREPLLIEAMVHRVDLARSLEDDTELGAALEAAALYGGADEETRADLWVDAAQAAARMGDQVRSLERARKAADAAPHRASTQLFARGLEYRLRGAGTELEAKATLAELAKVNEELEPEDVALSTFLAVEALTALGRVDEAALRLLQAHGEVGPQPLLALAMAERSMLISDFESAHSFYEAALEGNLLGFRSRGTVALAAASAALRADRLEAALNWLDEAAFHPESRFEALKKTAQVAAARGDLSRARTVLRELVRATTGEERTVTLAQLGRLLLTSASQDDFVEGEQVFVEAMANAPEGSVLSAQLSAELEALRQRRSIPSRAPEQQAGEAEVQKVLSALDPDAEPHDVPPLAAQREQPGTLTLITRVGHPAIREVLSLLWESAPEVFVREPPTPPGIKVVKGAEGPGVPLLLSLLQTATKLLGLPKVALHAQHEEGRRVSASVLVASPPAVVLSGDLGSDSPELRYALGQGLARALPQNILVAALPEAEGALMWRAMLGAFGPPEYGRQLDPKSGRLAESFWHTVPPRTQRRMQELLGAAPRTRYDDVVGMVRQSGRRLGLFLAGDFAVAARAFLAERALGEGGLRARGGVEALSQRFPEFSDLVELATSAEYAAARLRTGGGRDSGEPRYSPPPGDGASGAK
ncbi:hypothetical protein [Pendulispora albinea]|uniref:Tetratricopeptide repeat protein n=1 Tax=Pendulispora albinea TaxID=2741071 RepID=A0ABZ2M9E8_9BACT